MKNIKHLIQVMLCMLLFASCERLDKKLIHGSWQGAEWLIEGKSGDYDATSAQFSFDEKGRYSFNYAGSGESGKYHISNNELFTTPDGGIRMMVKIEKLTADSLVMQMNRGGTAETLTLVKK